MKSELNIPTMDEISMALSPILMQLKEIHNKVDSNSHLKKYYRNADLKKKFGLSDNTIISYRDKNILPFTKMGDIFVYPVDAIEKMLEQNSNFNLCNHK